MPDHRIGISLDVRQGQAIDRLQRDFDGVASSAQSIADRFKELERASRSMTARGWGSEQYTRQLRDQLNMVERMARLAERQARLAGNPTAQAQMVGVQSSIRQSQADISAVQGVMPQASAFSTIGSLIGAAIMTKIGMIGITGLSNGYSANIQQLPTLANIGKTMAPRGGDMAWAQNMLKSGQGYGYTNQEILSGAQVIQRATGKTGNFNDQIRGVAQFGRNNGFDYGQSAQYFSGAYRSGITGGSEAQMNWQQYAVLVANTVNAGNMTGKNAQVVEALQGLTAIAQQNMVNAPNQNMIAGLYATATKGGNQAFINQLPQSMAQIDSGIQNPGFGAMGQAAMFKMIAPGASYARAKIIQSRGAFGEGDNGKTNFENVLTGAYKLFGKDEDSRNLYAGQMLGIKPDMMAEYFKNYMNKDGTFNSTAFSKKKEDLKAELSDLDSIQQKTVNPAQRQQEIMSHTVEAGQSAKNAVFGNVVGNMGSVASGLWFGGHIAKKVFDTIRGGGGLTAAAGAGASGASSLGTGVAGAGASGAGAGILSKLGVAGITASAAIFGQDILDGIFGHRKGQAKAPGLFSNPFKEPERYSEDKDPIWRRKNERPSEKTSESSETSSTPKSFNASEAATQTAAILMALRPWASQIKGWYGEEGTKRKISDSVSSANIDSLLAPGVNPASMSGNKGITLLGTRSGGGYSSPSSPVPRGSYTGGKPANVPDKFWQAAVAAGEATGVDPILLAAIGQHETQWGTNPNSYPGFSLGYGDFGPGPKNKNWKYADKPGEFTNQTLSAAKQIGGYMKGKQITPESLRDFMNNSWKPGDKRWSEGIWNAYKSLGGTGGMSAGGAQVNVNAPKSITIQLTDAEGNQRGSGMIPLTYSASYNGLVTQ